ncbi:hypothetical protein HPB51_028153 [Rhipicephalus microplus]|uniref:Tetratricopeptide repeat protein n=1 Tax=Rhipicephalus microplus TaxID=6941 RepID=A0A9J6CYC6_RHIMP|nr:hypothetical protein HPB51_028153 [Rhipicephalus microplus]
MDSRKLSKMDNLASFSSSRITRSGIKDLLENAKMHYNYTNLQEDTGNMDLAIKRYRLAVDKQSLKYVARTLLERAIELDSDICDAYSSLAALAARKGDLVEAERLREMALRSDDRNADARNKYGTFFSHLSYEAAIRLDHHLAHPHLNFAVIRHLENDYLGAFRHHQVAPSLDPKNKLIIDSMAKLKRRITRSLTLFNNCV